MDKKIKDMYDKLNIITINRDDYNMLYKDRLDFGFDSIYFRYSEAIEELSWFKEREALKNGRDFDRKRWCDTKRQHFYGALEQLLHAHDKGEEHNG